MHWLLRIQSPSGVLQHAMEISAQAAGNVPWVQALQGLKYFSGLGAWGSVSFTCHPAGHWGRAG